MGYGFPAAIGAQIGNPDTRVIDIAGDGSIQMNIQELATAVIEKLPVIIAILNNGYLGMVRQWQELFYDHRYSATCLNPESSCPEVGEIEGIARSGLDRVVVYRGLGPVPSRPRGEAGDGPQPAKEYREPEAGSAVRFHVHAVLT